MPALPSVANALVAHALWSIGGDLNASTRTYFAYSGTAPNNTTCNTIAHDLLTEANTEFLPLMSPDVSLLGFKVTDLSSPSGGTSEYLATAPGTRSGGPLPAGVCAVWNVEIARRYRGGKPKQFYPFGVSSDLQSSLLWSTAFQTAVNGAVNTWTLYAATISVAGCNVGNSINISYYSGFASSQNPVTKRWRNIPTPRATPVVDSIVNYGCSLKVGSQRRRNANA